MSISSSASNIGGSHLLPLKIAGVAGRVHTLKASPRLAVPVGDPNDMGLLEYELRSDLLRLWVSPGGVVHMTGYPSAKFRSSFSWSVTSWEECPPEPSRRVE